MLRRIVMDGSVEHHNRILLVAFELITAIRYRARLHRVRMGFIRIDICQPLSR